MEILSIYSNEFKAYGQVLCGYDFTELFEALADCPRPEKGIKYVPSVKTLEACNIFAELQSRGFGGMPIQLGYCNGVNDTLNCLEYHKSSEFNIAKDDIVLLLGIQADIENGIYDTSKVQAFHVPAGTGVELFATTLHYAPCGYQMQEGFRVVCVLPKGTNEGKPEITKDSDQEAKMCYGTNKWLLAHPDAAEANQGAYIGLQGENLKYIKKDGGKENE